MAKKQISPDRLKFWQERVEKSNGKTFFIPESLLEEYQQAEEIRQYLESEQRRLAETAAEFQNKMDNFWFKLKKHLKDNGQPDIYTLDMGQDVDAREEGIGIINIIDPIRK